MAVVRPFRGLRPVPARVDPGALVAPGVNVDDATALALLARDPRNVIGLVRGDPARARFLVVEQLRAGVVARDALPSLYVLKVQTTSKAASNGDGDPASRIGFFAVVRADSIDVDADADDNATVDDDRDDRDDRAARLTAAGVAVEPVVISYVDKKGRVARSLESETEREPDASFEHAGQACELWAVDDDSAAARVTALVEGATLRVTIGGGLLARQRGLVDEDRAKGFALAFFVDDESPVEAVPVGVVLHSLAGAL